MPLAIKLLESGDWYRLMTLPVVFEEDLQAQEFADEFVDEPYAIVSYERAEDENEPV